VRLTLRLRSFETDPIEHRLRMRAGISARHLLGIRTGHLFAVIGPEGFPSQLEAIVGIEASWREKSAFIRRYKAQGDYAAVGRRIPFEELECQVQIESWNDSDAELIE
jgi:hypothetical protein